MENNHDKSIQDTVLAAITEGQVKMRPRWQFVLRGVLWALGGVFVGLAALFIASFIVFSMRQSGVWFAPAFGSPGLTELFTALPVLLVFVGILLVVLLELLVRHYSFSYGRPMIYSIIAIAVIVVAGTAVIAKTHVHEALLLRARHEQLPVAGRFYTHFGMPQVERITPGVIVEVVDDGYRLRDPFEKEFLIVVDENTRLPYGADFDIDDHIIVLGERADGTIIAKGIREIDPNDGPPIPPKSHEMPFMFRHE